MTTAFKRAALAALALSLAASALGDDAPAPALVKPPAALVLDGVPGVPARLAEKLEPYGDFRASSMMSWHPVRRELLVRRRLNATNQAHVVTEPGVAPDPVTDFPDAVPYASYEPSKGEYFVFTRAEGGNEVFRLFREDLPSRAVTALSPEGERVSDVSWTRRGDRLVLRPLMRSDWDAFDVCYRFGATTFDIVVRRATIGADRELTVDGARSPDGTVVLVDDGARHRVVLTLARGAPHAKEIEQGRNACNSG